MIQGIALFGENGSGKSTLAHVLAKRFGLFEMDAEDYYFPTQKASRIRALENLPELSGPAASLPFASPRTAQEAEAALLADIQAHPEFVLAAVTPKWNVEILSRIDLAFWIQAPMHIRLSRIQSREEKRFGSRVLPGGDMYEQQKAFQKMVQHRNPEVISRYAEKLPCPVIRLDGTRSVEENLSFIAEAIQNG